jgi:CheY-like chemotaxis protein
VKSQQVRILVVDDEDIVREFIGSALEEEGFDITLAQDGVDALEKLKDGPFDLAMVDLMMPRMDGNELINSIKSRETLKKMPIIVLTGDDREETVKRIISLGVEGFLVKATDVDEIIQRVKKTLKLA